MSKQSLTVFSPVADGIWLAVGEPERVNIPLVVGNEGAATAGLRST